VKLGEVYKKALLMVVMMSLILVSIELIYVLVMNVGVYGISSVIALRVYGWLMLGVGITFLLMTYLLGNVIIELN